MTLQWGASKQAVPWCLLSQHTHSGASHHDICAVVSLVTTCAMMPLAMTRAQRTAVPLVMTWAELFVTERSQPFFMRNADLVSHKLFNTSPPIITHRETHLYLEGFHYGQLKTRCISLQLKTTHLRTICIIGKPAGIAPEGDCLGPENTHYPFCHCVAVAIAQQCSWVGRQGPLPHHGSACAYSLG